MSKILTLKLNERKNVAAIFAAAAALAVASGALAQTRPDSALPEGDSGEYMLPDGTLEQLASASNVYVSAAAGNDSNPGSREKPFKTLARAVRDVGPGSTVLVGPGTYEGGIKTTASGTAGARIRYVSTTPWAAKIVPPANSKSATAWDNRGSYVNIDGFEVAGSKARAGTKWRSGIYNGGSFVKILRNHVYDIARNVGCTSGGGAGIGVDSYYKGRQSDVVGNVVHDIGPKGCRFIQGIYVSTSGSIKNNQVYRVAEGGIHLWHDASDVIITNNTVAACNTGIIVGGGDFYYSSGGNDNTRVFSNIVYDNKAGISEQGKTGKRNSYRNNLVYKNSAYNFSLKNGLQAVNTVASEPLFAGYGRAGYMDLRITRSSPAIGRGSDQYAESVDFNGRPRNAATGFDIGAYQH
jgi:parallel beta-helix repeat protein